MVEASSEPFLRFDLEYQQLLILQTEAARAATPAILGMHCIASDRSADLGGGAAAAGGAAVAAVAAGGCGVGVAGNQGGRGRKRGAALRGKGASAAAVGEVATAEDEEEALPEAPADRGGALNAGGRAGRPTRGKR